jgi:branched-chain amino acid transport system permease protein
VSELVAERPAEVAPQRVASKPRPVRRGPLIAKILLVAAAALLPFLAGRSWTSVCVLALTAAIGAIALNLLVGTTGQLSLAQPFFLVIGAYGYTLFSSQPVKGIEGQSQGSLGFHLPPLLAAVVAVLLAGVLGLAFSPISSRLRGIYLGVASLALVEIGQHFIKSAKNMTGGFTGRDVPPLDIFGFVAKDDAPNPTFLGHVVGKSERLYLIALVLLVGVAWFTNNVIHGRPGRALQALRDNQTSASVMGVDVRRYKAMAFMTSAMIAAIAGVLLSQFFGHLVPDNWDFDLAVSYLAMVVIGGLGSVGGSILGAVFVTFLPFILNRYGEHIPGVIAGSSTDGFASPGQLSALLFGGAIVVLLLFEPGGLAALFRRLPRALKRSSSTQ